MNLTSEHPFWSVRNGILSTYPPLLENGSCEVLVLGAGITGALVTEALAADGHDVITLDARDVGRGSTSASTALLQYEVDTHLVDLIARHGRRMGELAYMACHESIDILERRIQASSIDCDFLRKDSVYLASREKDWPVLREEGEARRKIGIQVAEWDATEVAAKFGFYRPGALHSVQAAEVDAYRLTHGLLQAATARGGRIFDRTAATEINHHAGGVTVTTDRGTSVRARKVVVATGYEASELFDTGRFVNLNSSFAIASEPIPDAEPWWRRCLLWESARPYFYLRGGAGGRAIFGGEDVPFRNAKARDRVLPAKADKLAARFRDFFPAIRMEPAFEWAGTFGETEDGLAYIGPYNKHPDCLFALGFGGNGITYSVIAAEIIRSHLKGKKHRYAGVFRFDR
ncbi:FAD-dependent oxidoreductase [Luteolibacter sp. SL250]|uniref:NAD(P)/FAD-dependent oxidoreductase n=1 Tax=Luteolibacter sp. SL250 TaxID=2995170 RepID=UPI00226D7205|nr:FAD-dependent oxidoreductase [Luteolibacter sp. SL250]WAC19386.1 FAD-dependent oxidoreductase [Luteolibacter sp. SL250]